MTAHYVESETSRAVIDRPYSFAVHSVFLETADFSRGIRISEGEECGAICRRWGGRSCVIDEKVERISGTHDGNVGVHPASMAQPSPVIDSYGG